MSDWQKVISLEELEEKNRTVFKHERKQIAVFKINDNIFAVDNRCPHEGYPLIQGTVDENCKLTCNWHNWKFELNSGKCLIGADNVRAYQTKAEDEIVYVDISEAPKEETEKKILEDLTTAYEKRQYGRIARELSRLYFNELDPISGLKKIIEVSYERFEYGMTHAYATAADWLSLYLENEDKENKIICLTEAIDHISLDTLRHPEYKFTDEKKEYSSEAFLNAIESENEHETIALLNGAFESGKSFHDLEKDFSGAALAHYNDFGHSLIYVYKTRQLIYALGKEVEKALSLSLARSLCYASREDLIPEFRDYSEFLHQIKENKVKEKGSENDDLLKLHTKQSMEWVAKNYQENNPSEIFEALLKANAFNMLHYDMNYQFATDNKVDDNIGWLDFTHALTFSNAVRIQCERFPEYWTQGLLQLACFNGRNKAYLDHQIRLEDWKVNDTETFWQKTMEKIYDHGIGAPIFAAHLLKTAMAVREETERNISEETKIYLLASLNRFLNSPIKGKHVKRTVKQSVSLVQKDFKL